jgi:precorrin-4/cobalt-precorrin-4 C11-methyltransferase
MPKKLKKEDLSENSVFRIPNSDFQAHPHAKLNNPILFVGAGPGDPELITVKGQNALKAADVVIYAGSLVPQELLQWTRPGTKALNSASMNLEEIIEEIENAHSKGKRVVRLHTGDPSLYGAIFEQMVELQQRNIPYQVIPGVTAAFAAAAALNLEYTLPEISQTLVLTRMAGRTPVPEKETLAELAKHQASMAIYLSMSMVAEVADILAAAYGSNATCAVVYRASQPEEKVIVTTLTELAATAAAEKISKQALIIVSKVLDVGPANMRHKSKLYDKTFKHEYRR